VTRPYIRRAPALTPTPAQRRTNASWLRAQLRDLAFEAALNDFDTARLVVALSAIADGRDWRTT
jgi:hypothetical protein